MKTPLIPTLLFLLIGLAVPRMTAQTGETPHRIAVVDVDRLIADTRVGQAASERYGAVHLAREAEAVRKDSEIQQAEADLKKNASKLGEAKRAQLERELADKRAALERWKITVNHELEQVHVREYGPFRELLRTTLATLGKEQRLGAIFSAQESGFLHFAATIDITDEVIKRMNSATTK